MHQTFPGVGASANSLYAIRRDDGGTEKRLSIVIPVFENEGSLPELFEEISKVESELASLGIGLELIFVDDGSTDGSLAKLFAIKAARPETKIVKHSRNFGSMAACKTGFSYVTGDAFLLLAADLQDPPSQIMPMVRHWLNGSRFVICVRDKRRDPATSMMWAWLYYKLVKLFVMPEYPATGYDLMLMDSVMLPHMIHSTKNTNVNVYSYWLGFQPTTLYYERAARKHGKSKWSFAKKLKLFSDTICGFSVAPIRFMSIFGTITAFVSFLYGAHIIVAALLGKVPVQGFATLAALISFFSGVIVFMLGTLGEYLWRVFDSVGNKPESVVESAYL